MSYSRYFHQLPKQLQTFLQKYPPSIKYATKPVSTHDPTANPFLANKHPVTSRYHDAKYSARRMSVLYKLAYKHGIESFMPPTNKKFYEEKYEQKSKDYSIMKGVTNPAGHKFELEKPAKMKAREEAIANADQILIDAKGRKFARKLEKKKKLAEKTLGWY